MLPVKAGGHQPMELQPAPAERGSAEACGGTQEVLLGDEASWMPHGWVEPQVATGADR